MHSITQLFFVIHRIVVLLSLHLMSNPEKWWLLDSPKKVPPLRERRAQAKQGLGATEGGWWMAVVGW